MQPTADPIDLVGEIAALFIKMYQVNPEHPLLQFAAPLQNGDTLIDPKLLWQLEEEFCPTEDGTLEDALTEFLHVLSTEFEEAAASVPVEQMERDS